MIAEIIRRDAPAPPPRDRGGRYSSTSRRAPRGNRRCAAPPATCPGRISISAVSRAHLGGDLGHISRLVVVRREVARYESERGGSIRQRHHETALVAADTTDAGRRARRLARVGRGVGRRVAQPHLSARISAASPIYLGCISAIYLACSIETSPTRSALTKTESRIDQRHARSSSTQPGPSRPRSIFSHDDACGARAAIFGSEIAETEPNSVLLHDDARTGWARCLTSLVVCEGVCIVFAPSRQTCRAA